MIKKQIRAPADMAADDLTHHGEPIEAVVWARLEGGEYTEEQVLGDRFPEIPAKSAQAGRTSQMTASRVSRSSTSRLVGTT